MCIFDKINDQLTDLYFEQNGFQWVNESECFFKYIVCKISHGYAYFPTVIVEPIQHKYIDNKKPKSPYRMKIGNSAGEYTKYFYLDTITDFELYVDQFIKSLKEYEHTR